MLATGRSALALAAIAGEVDAVRAHVDAGHGVGERDDDGWTALMHAAYRNHAGVVSVLLQAGASLEPTASNGADALMAASRSGAADAVASLLAAGADPARITPAGASALSFAAGRGRTAVLTALVEAGADVDHRDRKQRTPLILAATRGHAEAVDVLLRLGADVDAVEHVGYRALHLAGYKNHPAVVRRLLAAGADPASTSDDGWTALMIAASNCSVAVGAPLLDAGCPLDHTDTDGHSALYLAAAAGCEAMVRLLLARGADTDPGDRGETALHAAAQTGDLRVAAQLLHAGLSPMDADEQGRTPYSVAKRSSRWVAELMKTGDDKVIEALARDVAPPVLETWWPAVEEDGGGCVIRPGWIDIAGPDGNRTVTYEAFLAGAEQDRLRKAIGDAALPLVVEAVQNADANPRLHVERRMDTVLADAWQAIPIDDSLVKLAISPDDVATRRYLNDDEGITRVDLPGGREVRVQQLSAIFPTDRGHDRRVPLDDYHGGAVAFGNHVCLRVGAHILILDADGDEAYNSHRHKETYALGTRCCVRDVMRCGDRLLVEYDNYAFMEPSRFTRAVGRRGYVQIDPELGPIARYPLFA